MAQDRSQLNQKIAELQQNEAALVEAVNMLFQEITNLINRFLAKIAAGSDYQAEVDTLQAISQPLLDTKAQVDTKIAEVQLEAQ